MASSLATGSSVIENSDTGVGQDYGSADRAALAFNNQAAAVRDLANPNLAISKAPTVSPTVMTDANVRETTIPNTIQKANTMVGPAAGTLGLQNGQGEDQTGGNGESPAYDPNTSYADIYKSTLNGLNDEGNDDTTNSELALLDDMHDTRDVRTSTQLDAIRSAYKDRSVLLQRGQESQAKGVQNALINSGASRYAPVSSAGILSEEENSNIRQLSGLDREEQNAELDVIKAQQDQDYQELGKKLEILDSVRTQKQALAKTISDNIYTQNTKLDDEHRQSVKDNAIADLVQKGVTDPKEILDNLTKSGLTATAKDVAATLGNISTTLGAGNIDKLSSDVRDFYILKNMPGGLPGSITALPEDEQMLAYVKSINGAQKTGSSSGGLGGGTGSTIQLIAQGIMNGNQPPSLTGLYGKSGDVRAELEKNGYDLTQATEDWTATQKLLGTLNGAQQTRLRESINQVDESLPLVSQLVNEWDAGGFPVLNKTKLIAAKNGLLGADAQRIATQLDAEIADVTSELSTVYKGGNSSTDESLKLAGSQLSSDWSKDQLLSAIDLAKKNIQYRKNSLNLTTAGITDSTYNQTDGQTPAGYDSDDEDAAKQKVINYGAKHPEIQATITSYLTKDQPGVGRPYTYQEVEQLYGMI